MKNYLLILIKILCFVFLYNVASAQDQHSSLKLTAKELMKYLLKCDTANIHRLFDDDARYNNVKDNIKGDSKLMAAIVKKYGDKMFNSMSLEKGKYDENVVLVTLLNKPDSSLNLKKCELVVIFYPDRFLSYSRKVLNYILFKPLLKEPEKKLLRLPSNL